MNHNKVIYTDMNNTIKNRWFFVVIFLTALLTGCNDKKNVNDHEYSEQIVTPTTIVNLREGPGKDYAIIKGIKPGEKLIAETAIDGEWIKVSTDRGLTGFVAGQYVEVIPLTDSKTSSSTSTNNSFHTYTKRDSNIYSDTPDKTSIFVRYIHFMKRDAGFFIIVLLLVVEIFVSYFLKKRYDYIYRRLGHDPASVKIGLICIIISIVLTVFQILAIFSVRNGASGDDLLYFLMLLSTGIIMVIIPWRLRLSGLNSVRHHPVTSGYSRVKWANTLGIWTWLILLFPISIILIQNAGDASGSRFTETTFWSMVFDMGIFCLVTWLFCRFFWPLVVVKYLFKSMHSGVLWCVNMVLILSLARYGYNICDVSFTGVNYIVSLWLLFFIIALDCCSLFNVINEKRCGNCHNFEGEYTGSTSLGSTYYTSREWEKIDNASIVPERSDAIVSDAQRLVSTTKRTDRWKTHHQCSICSNKWDIDNSTTTTVDSHTVKREWTEYH